MMPEYFTLYARSNEYQEMEKRDYYSDFEVACKMAEELVRQGFVEAKVKDEAGKTVYHITN